MTLKRPALLLLFLAAVPAPRARANGQPLEEEKLINVGSPHTVGRHKVRFDFQHAFSDGTTYSGRLPVADLLLVFGLTQDVHVEWEGLFNNSRVQAGAQTAESKFTANQGGVKWRFLNQFAGAPLSASAALYYQHAAYKVEFNKTAAVATSYSTLAEEVMVQRDFPWVEPTLAYRRMDVDFLAPGRTRHLYALQAGLRAKLLRAKNNAMDLVGDATLAHKTDGLGFKKAWGAGLQLTAYSPHTFTFFLSNTSGQTLPDAAWGYNDTFKSFRWSYRF